MYSCTSARENRKAPPRSGQEPSPSDSLPPGAELPGVAALVGALAAAGMTSVTLELVPRISRAQSVDALSSQSLTSG